MITQHTVLLFPFSRTPGVCDYSFQQAFICKRNERERKRVHCVSEGYAWLREHLPQELKDKRLNKVETLWAAIYYIKHLQSLLDLNGLGDARNCDAATGMESTRSSWHYKCATKSNQRDTLEIRC